MKGFAVWIIWGIVTVVRALLLYLVWNYVMLDMLHLHGMKLWQAFLLVFSIPLMFIKIKYNGGQCESSEPL